MLATIDDPSALRGLGAEELTRVAHALRRHLIELGASVGGHFAGSLGTVELTVALHAVFDTPHDRIVWDVGHQAHGHKILTGRRDAMRRVKRADGPAGFLRRCESPYDAFGAGHAGTSVSAALGMAEASARLGTRRFVVAVIGDGSATSGLSFEGLNHAAGLASALRVVLNDNGMSIAPSTGGLCETGDFRGYATALGWHYVGPVDGHDLPALCKAMGELREGPGPSLLHVKTRKGRGYPPAERDPYGWHATRPFDVGSGRRSSAPAAPPSWTDAFADALARIADRDDRVVAITAAMPDGTGLDRFGERHPDRVYDVGIAEQHAVTFAAGLAAEGLRPVCAIYSTFLQRAFDQIVHDVALQDLPVTFAIDRAGLVGADGPTHHGALDLAYLRAIPGLVVAAPRDADELQHLLATAIDSGRPFAIRYPRGAATGALDAPEPKPLAIGRGELLRCGDRVAIVAIGKAVTAALAAADRLAALGVEASVVDARFAKPLDVALLRGVAETTGHVVTVEDHARIGGLGSAVVEALADTGARGPGGDRIAIRRLGLPDRFVQHAEADAQWREAGIDRDAIVAAVLALLGEEKLR
jgi:1-deoxy-D-xylulose-5-phosphate synthase